MRGALQPLMMVLHIGVDVYRSFSAFPDVGIILFCFVVSSLLSVIYLVPWALLITYLRKKPISLRATQIVATAWIGGITATILAEATRSPVLMMAAGTILVTATAGLTMVTVSQVITRYVNRFASRARTSKFT